MGTTSKMMLNKYRRPVINIINDLELGLMALGDRKIVGMQRLASDPIGTVTLTLNGVKPGSEVHIIDYAASIISSVESTVGDPSFPLSVYQAGNVRNTIRILVVSLSYEVLDLSFTLTNVNASIPVFQRVDRNYRNPP